MTGGCLWGFYCGIMFFSRKYVFLQSNQSFSIMTAKEKDIAEAKRQEKELLALLLEKTGVKKQDLIDMIYREFIKDNLALITPAERKRFTKLVF